MEVRRRNGQWQIQISKTSQMQVQVIGHGTLRPGISLSSSRRHVRPFPILAQAQGVVDGQCYTSYHYRWGK
jgi:hypothetical protein